MIHALAVLAKRIVAAAAAWVRKYLTVASTARGEWDLAISGSIASVFISRPIQASIQWADVIVRRVPRIRLASKIRVMKGLIW